MADGRNAPLVHLRSAGERLTAAHDLLGRRFSVIALETPGPGGPSERAATVAEAVDKLGVETFNLMATSDAAGTALCLALEGPRRVLALVLESPPAASVDGELATRLAGLATPMLTLAGTRDDGVAPVNGANSHLVYVYDAGRAIGADRPEALAEVVVDFLERHEAFVISRTPTVIHP